MKEIKLSPQERDLLVALYESDLYTKGLKPFLNRKGQALAGLAVESTQNFEEVMLLRGKLQFMKELHRFLKSLSEKPSGN